ncbi:MAG: hypothetical protein U1A78_38035 [Polyangia bacterium]
MSLAASLAILITSGDAQARDQLRPGQYLNPGESLVSANGLYKLIMQTDGNLVLYQNQRALWSSRSNGSQPKQAIMQTDGNFVVYFNNRGPWATGPRVPGSYIVMQDDGNVVVYGGGRAVWASGTNQPPPPPAGTLQADRQDKLPGTNVSMKTKIIVSRSGNVTMTTNTWTRVQLRGWTGGVYAVFFTADRDGWVSPFFKYGVDGCMVGRCDRTDTQTFSLPAHIAGKVKEVAIVHEYAPTPRYGDALRAVVGGAKQFGQAFDSIKSDLTPFIVALASVL